MFDSLLPDRPTWLRKQLWVSTACWSGSWLLQSHLPRITSCAPTSQSATCNGLSACWCVYAERIGKIVWASFSGKKRFHPPRACCKPSYLCGRMCGIAPWVVRLLKTQTLNDPNSGTSQKSLAKHSNSHVLARPPPILPRPPPRHTLWVFI